VVIRSFRKGDAAALFNLICALARYEHLTPPTRAAGRRLVRNIGRRIHVKLALVEGRAVGYAIYLFTYSSFLARPTLYLEDIFVLPECRRHGIGKAFFRTLLREAKREGCGRMEWTVLDWNKPALAFYRKLRARLMREWILVRKIL
jgi:GNAT superfamily N-acetyltransferase